MNTIKMLRIICRDCMSEIEVGANNVAKIIDYTREDENCYNPVFNIYDKDDKLLRSIINCPVDIIYFK